MTLFVRSAAVIILVALQAAPTIFADEQNVRFRGEATVNVVEVPVHVIDPATGEAVIGLTGDDFEIRENGSPQEVSNFAELWRSESDAAEEAALRPTAIPPDDQDIRTRTVELVYLLDLYLMNKEGRNRAVDGLVSSFRNGVPDGQNVSLVVYDGTLETLVDRSDDPRELLDALDEVRYMRSRGDQQTIALTQELAPSEVSGERDQSFYERRQRSREFIAELEKRVLRVGNAALATMARYATADGRRVLVMFTPGHPRTKWSPSYGAVDYVNAAAEYPVHDLWRDIAHEAADLGFTVYIVDSSGVRADFGSDVEVGITDTLDDSFDRGSVFRDQAELAIEPVTAVDPDFAFDPGGETQDLGNWLEQTRKSMMLLAATDTGGAAIFDTDVGAVVDRVNRALGHHYSLAYVADHSGDGKTHTIEVRVPAHPEYRVVARRAYVDQPAAVRSGRRIRSAMLFGADANPLGARVEVGEADSRFRLGAAGSKRVTVPLEIKIPYGRLDMIERGDRYSSTVWITLFAEDAAGNQSALSTHEQSITVAADRYREAVAKGYFSYRTGVEIEGGSQRVFVGLQEEVSGRTSIVPLEFGN